MPTNKISKSSAKIDTAELRYEQVGKQPSALTSAGDPAYELPYEAGTPWTTPINFNASPFTLAANSSFSEENRRLSTDNDGGWSATIDAEPSGGNSGFFMLTVTWTQVSEASVPFSLQIKADGTNNTLAQTSGNSNLGNNKVNLLYNKQFDMGNPDITITFNIGTVGSGITTNIDIPNDALKIVQNPTTCVLDRRDIFKTSENGGAKIWKVVAISPTTSGSGKHCALGVNCVANNISAPDMRKLKYNTNSLALFQEGTEIMLDFTSVEGGNFGKWLCYISTN